MIRFSFALALFLLVSGCTESTQKLFNPADPFAHSSWIAGTEALPEQDSLFYLDHPAPLLRGSFRLKKVPENAKIWITAAGYYTIWVNGKKVGNQELAPAWTDYSKRIYYQQLDLTSFLVKGTNVIAVELGNGWYNPLPLRMWGGRNLRNDLPIGKPRVILAVTGGPAGTEKLLASSGPEWKTFPGPILRNNVYLGEIHDMSKEPTGWKEAGFDGSDWDAVEVVESPGGQLVPEDFPPIRKTAQVKPKAIWKSGPGKWTIDFGQNMAGWMQYTGPVLPGDSIRFRFGERIWPDSTVNTMTAVCGQIKRAGVGGPGAPAIAEQVDVFIPSEKGQSFEPRYTFHGFRYVELQVNPNLEFSEPGLDDFIAYRLGSDVARAGILEGDPKWINQIQKMVEWTYSSNVFSVASDCPAREKFGYGGDMSATAETWLYNYEVKTLFVKFIRDWKDAMREGRFVDTAPFVGIQYCGISWESNYMMLQDWLFRFYGDLDLVKEWYPANQAWIQKSYDLLGLDLVRNGLSDHECLLPVPVELVGTANYYKSLRTMQKFAGLVSDTESESKYKSWADAVQIIMRDSLWKSPVKKIENTQTWMSTLLYHDILAPADQPRALKLLLEDLDKRGNRQTTGIFGTPWMLEVLSKNGQVQQAFDLVARKDYPGWRFMLDNGATTVWETWKESDNVFSQNHPMFGVVSAWFYKWIGGIDPVDGGFSRIMIHPAPVKGINQLSVSRRVDEGEVAVSWIRNEKTIVFQLTVPNQTQVIWVPQLLNPSQLQSIIGPDGKEAVSDKPQIIFNDPGTFQLTYDTEGL